MLYMSMALSQIQSTTTVDFGNLYLIYCKACN